jgi:hypothetical protein
MQSPNFFKEPKNRFQGTNSARLCSLAGRYDNPIPTRFLAPIDCLKISAQVHVDGKFQMKYKVVVNPYRFFSDRKLTSEAEKYSSVTLVLVASIPNYMRAMKIHCPKRTKI